MKLAYIITAYKNPSQLFRLVNSLYSEDISFYIHVDRKSDLQLFKKELSFLPPPIRVEWLKREYVNWGGFGIVQAVINGLSSVLKIEPSVDYIVLLSEKDYPIKPVREILSFFEKRIDVSFVDSFLLPYSGWPNGGMDRIQKYYFRLFGKRYQFPQNAAHKSGSQKLLSWVFGLYFSKTRNYPEGLKPFGGSGSWCINALAARYILEFIAQRPDYMRFHKYSHAPDEGFFQTILLNSSEFGNAVINEDLHYVEWAGGAHPHTFSRDDFVRLERSPKLYARKFDMEQDTIILDLIDEKLLGLKILG